ncbi:unnamed protein product [Calypogeia fissa]
MNKLKTLRLQRTNLASRVGKLKLQDDPNVLTLPNDYDYLTYTTDLDELKSTQSVCFRAQARAARAGRGFPRGLSREIDRATNEINLDKNEVELGKHGDGGGGGGLIVV